MDHRNEPIFEYVVQSEDVLSRVDKFLAAIYETLSRTTIQTMLKEGMVLVNSKIAKGSQLVKVGDIISIVELPIFEMELEPEDIPLDIVYEDDDVLVVNKPTGMVVHPAPGHYHHTLVNALLYHVKALSNESNPIRPGIVHRIDKDTSGLLMVAKTDIAHQHLADELKMQKTYREYMALVEGNVRTTHGTIQAPIGRDKTDRKKMAVVEEGKEATTHFEVIKQYVGYTLLKCRLETGRTHQIRVHLAFIHHPVVGDPVYGKKRLVAKTGQYLHAKTLSFTHPVTKQWMQFDSVLPDYFEEYLQQLEPYAETK